MKNNKLITKLLLIALIAFNVSFLSKVKQVEAAADSDLYFSPSPTTVVVGSDFTLALTVNPGTNLVNGIDLAVNFDQTKLRLDSISQVSPFTQVIVPASINNNTGVGTISLGVAFGSNVTTTSTIANLNFHALAQANNTSVSFAPATLLSAENETIDVAKTKTAGVVIVNAAPADSTAPVRSNGAPTGTLAAGTTQTTVSLTTNENATCKYATTAGVAYASMGSDFTTTGGTTHLFTASSLVNGTDYSYFVRCIDGANNPNTDDYQITFSIAAASVTPANPPSSPTSSKKSSTSSRSLSNSKDKIKKGDILIQKGKKFSKNSYVLLYFGKPGGGYYAPQKVKTDAKGAFNVSYKVNKPIGKYYWFAIDQKTGKKSKLKSYTVK